MSQLIGLSPSLCTIQEHGPHIWLKFLNLVRALDESCLTRLPNECLNFLLSFTTSPCLPPQSAFPQSFHHRVVWHQTHQLCLCGTDLQNNFHTLLLLARVLFLVSWAGVTTGPDRETQIIKGYHAPPGGGGVLPYKGLMGTCGQPGYVFRDFCLKQGIEFINFCLKQGIKNRNSVLNRVGKSAIFVLNRVRVWGAAPHLPTQGYIEYPPRTTPPCNSLRSPDVFRVSEIRQRFTGYHAKAVPVIPSRGTRKQQGNRRQPCLDYLLMLSGLDFCYVQPSVFCLEIVKRACENKHRVNTAVDLFVFEWVITLLIACVAASLRCFRKVTCFFTNNNLRTTKQRQAS